MSLFSELKRRKVFRVAVVYAIVGWLLVQVADITFPRLLLPDWLQTAVIVLLLMGFPVSLILAWAFEIRPDTTPRDDGEAGVAVPLFSGAWIRGGYLVFAAGILALGLAMGSLIGRIPATVTTPAVSAGPAIASPLILPLQLTEFADSRRSFAGTGLAISPDGRQIAYVGFDGTDLYLYIKNDVEARPRKVPNTEGAAIPFFSPDGDWVAFFAGGRLQQVATAGGQPIEIANLPGLPMGGSWGDDGSIVFGLDYRSPLYRVSPQAGNIESVIELPDGHQSHRYPAVLPGSKAILFEVFNVGNPLQIWVLDLASGELSPLVNGWYPRYTNGRLLYLRQGAEGSALWSVGFDVLTLKTSGDPKPLASDSMNVFDVARSGSLIYSQNRPQVTTRLVIVDESGNETVLHEGFSDKPRFSPDGGLLVARSGASIGDSELWLFDPDGNQTERQLTFDGAFSPAWSWNSLEIAYEQLGVGIVSKKIGSAEPPRSLLEKNGTRVLPIQWRDDGLLFSEINPLTGGDMYFMRNDGKIVEIEVDESIPAGAEIRPDGQWIAYARLESTRPDVYVAEFPERTIRIPVSGHGGNNPKWSSDGDRLYYHSYGRIMAVDVTEDDPLSFGEPYEVHRIDGPSYIGFDLYDVSPDGKSFAIVDRIYGEQPPVIYVSDWEKAFLDD